MEGHSTSLPVVLCAPQVRATVACLSVSREVDPGTWGGVRTIGLSSVSPSAYFLCKLAFVFVCFSKLKPLRL